jgi:hypothetical protein
MFALPHPPALFPSPLLLVALGALLVAAGLLALNFAVFRRQGAPSPAITMDAETRKCRYCRRGDAVLREESVRLEGDDLVDVRCYVCAGCGLPQWWIGRRAITPHVR